MGKSFKLKKGTKANLPQLAVGEPGYCYDTNELFVGSYDGNRVPNNIVYLKSPSNKIFKLVVDDAGALSTSEVI